jgi:hypothetical protein
VKKSKCAGLAQDIGFSAPNSRSFPWLVKGLTQLCTSKKKCTKLDLTDWSTIMIDPGGFAISSSHVYAVSVTILLVGLPKKKKLNLDI